MKTCRQVVKDYCADKVIPVDEAMATIDTDFASEPQTCDEDVSDGAVMA